MSLLQAYLRNPKTQRVLSHKPGDKGFSLIELVVVVAVLAILAAIAIPQFTSLSDDARLNSSKSIIANIYKECEFNKARTGTGTHSAQTDGTPNGVFWNATAKATTDCSGYAVAKIGGSDLSTGAACIIAMDLSTGDTYYENAASPPAAGNNAWTKPWANNLEDCT